VRKRIKLEVVMNTEMLSEKNHKKDVGCYITVR
jgi:hypothetical protein